MRGSEPSFIHHDLPGLGSCASTSSRRNITVPSCCVCLTMQMTLSIPTLGNINMLIQAEHSSLEERVGTSCDPHHDGVVTWKISNPDGTGLGGEPHRMSGTKTDMKAYQNIHCKGDWERLEKSKATPPRPCPLNLVWNSGSCTVYSRLFQHGVVHARRGPPSPGNVLES